LEEFDFFFPVQMIINLQAQKLCMYVSSMNLFVYLIVTGAYNENIGVNFTILVFSIFKTNRLPWNERARFAFRL